MVTVAPGPALNTATAQLTGHGPALCPPIGPVVPGPAPLMRLTARGPAPPMSPGLDPSIVPMVHGPAPHMISVALRLVPMAPDPSPPMVQLGPGLATPMTSGLVPLTASMATGPGLVAPDPAPPVPSGPAHLKLTVACAQAPLFPPFRCVLTCPTVPGSSRPLVYGSAPPLVTDPVLPIACIPIPPSAQGHSLLFVPAPLTAIPPRAPVALSTGAAPLPTGAAPLMTTCLHPQGGCPNWTPLGGHVTPRTCGTA